MHSANHRRLVSVESSGGHGSHSTVILVEPQKGHGSGLTMRCSEPGGGVSVVIRHLLRAGSLSLGRCVFTITACRKTQRGQRVNCLFDAEAFLAEKFSVRNLSAALVFFLLLGCATVQPGNQSAEVRAEQTLAISLAALDSFLAFEARRRADVPAEVRDIAARVRAKAPAALESANRLRLAYKLNRSGANESSLLTGLAVVESLVAEIRVWVPKTSAGQAASPVAALVREAEASKVKTTSSWVALVPVFVDLAREIFTTVNRVRESAKQSAEWTAEEDAQFASRLAALASLPHWKP